MTKEEAILYLQAIRFAVSEVKAMRLPKRDEYFAAINMAIEALTEQ